MPVSSSKPIDVSIISRWFYPTLTGPGERFRRYAPGLRKRGIHLRVFTIQQPGRPLLETIDGIPVHRFPVGVDRDCMSTALLRKALSSFRHAEQWPDVVQLLSHSKWSMPNIWLARFRGLPFLFVSTMMRAGREKSPRLRERVAHFLLFQPLNCLVVSSTVMAQSLVRRGVSPERVEVIPNGVDLQRFRPAKSPRERDEIRQRLGIALDDDIMLFVGTIMQRKGVDTLLSAWPEIIRRRPCARLLLVGPLPGRGNAISPLPAHMQAFIDKIEHIVLNAPSPERVVLIGERPDVEAYMRAADVFVFPSRREGMPNVVPEAMASGLPCVLTPFEGLPTTEFGKPGREFLLVPRDPHKLAATVLEVLESENARRVLGQSARSWVERHLDVETSLDRFAQLYRRLAERNRHRKGHSK